MNPVTRAYLELHLAVLLFGFTAILGDLIQLSAMNMVWWRMLLASISLVVVIRLRGLWQTMPGDLIRRFMGIGVIVALHWICFFGSIKLANASIGVICMATTTFFTSLLEPLFLKIRVSAWEILLGLMVVPGMALVVGTVGTEMWLGILVGLLSAFLAALFAVLNKVMIEKAHPLNITLLELGAGWIFISCLVPFFHDWSGEAPFLPGFSDWIYLVILAFVCTTLAYVLALRSLRHLSAFASNLTINLEPVYGIALAWFILNENQELQPGFYYGVLLILVAVFSYPAIKRKIRPSKA